jgi:DNA-binding beta-propeller fold protein YncE
MQTQRRRSRQWLSIALAALVSAFIVPSTALANRNLYVVGDFSGSVAALDVGAGGSLTPVIGSPFITPGAETKPVSVAISPDGRHAYVTDSGSELNPGPGSVAAFSLALNGGLVPIAGSFLTGLKPLGNAVSPDGRFMYVVDRDSKDVTAFEIQATGAMTLVPGSPFPIGGEGVGIALSADGRSLYTQNQEGTVSALRVGPEGALTPIAGSPFPAGTSPWAGAVTPDGRFLFVVDKGSDTVSRFAISPDGTPVPLAGATPVGGSSPTAIAMAPDGRHLYVVFSAGVAGFAISPAGDLTPVPGSPISIAGARVGAVAPDGSTLYVGAKGTGANVYGFAIAPDGSLAPLGGSPFASGVDTPDVQAMAFTPDQGPKAFFSATITEGMPVLFNASGSSDADGSVVRYDWDFGDGTTAPNGGVAPAHTYARPGAYQVKLTVTDNEGCSTSVVFTGQTASCNGSAAATATAVVNVPVPLKPILRLSGRRVQKLGRWLLVKASAGLPARFSAGGVLVVRRPDSHGAAASKAARRSFKLGKATASAQAGKRVTLRLKVPKHARKVAARALAGGGEARARLKVRATTAAGGKSTAKRTIGLRGR